MTERRPVTFGPFRLDVFQNRLWRQAQPIALRPQALAVLRYLVMHSDRLVTKAELLPACVGRAAGDGLGAAGVYSRHSRGLS